MMLADNNIPMQTGKVDTFLAVSFVTLMIVSGYFVFFFNWSAPTSSGGEALAQLTSKYDDVQVKEASSLAWRRTQVGVNLYENDEVFAHSNSRAEISYHQGPKIDLEQNSLVRITKQNDESELVVLRGFVSGSSGSKSILIKVGEKRVSLSSAEFEVMKLENAEPKLSLSKGTATIGDQKIEEGSEVLLQKELKIVKFAYISETPKRNKQFAPGKPVEFAWRKTDLAESNNYFLVIARDAAFRSVVQRIETSELSASVNSLPPGMYFWKVIGKQNTGELSRVGTFTIVGIKAPTQLASSFRTVEGGTESASILKYPVTLYWLARGDGEIFEVQIAHKKEFKEVIVSERVPENQFLVMLARGTYYWRARSVQGNFVSRWSPINTIVVGEKSALEKESIPVEPELPPLLPPPDLNQEYEFELPDGSGWIPKFNFSLFEVAYAQVPKILFRWPAVPGAKKYAVQVSVKEDFSKPAIDVEAEKPEVDLGKLKEGLYFIRIASVDTLGRLGGFSKPARIRITENRKVVAVAPSQSAPKPLAPSGPALNGPTLAVPKPTMRKSSATDARKVQKDTRKVQKDTRKESVSATPLPTPQATPIPHVEEASKQVEKQKAKVQAPALRARPIFNQASLGSSATVQVAFPADKRDHIYEMQVSKSENFENPFRYFNSKPTVSASFSEGRYFVRARVCDFLLGCSPWSEVSNVEIVAPKPERERFKSSGRFGIELVSGPSIENYQLSSSQSNTEFNGTTSYRVFSKIYARIWVLQLDLYFNTAPLDNGVDLPVDENSALNNFHREVGSILSWSHVWMPELRTVLGLGVGNHSNLFLDAEDAGNLKLFSVSKTDLVLHGGVESIFWDRALLQAKSTMFLNFPGSDSKINEETQLRMLLSAAYLFDYDFSLGIAYLNESSLLKFESLQGNRGSVETAAHMFGIVCGAML